MPIVSPPSLFPFPFLSREIFILHFSRLLGSEKFFYVPQLEFYLLHRGCGPMQYSFMLGDVGFLEKWESE